MATVGMGDAGRVADPALLRRVRPLRALPQRVSDLPRARAPRWTRRAAASISSSGLEDGSWRSTPTSSAISISASAAAPARPRARRACATASSSRTRARYLERDAPRALAVRLRGGWSWRRFPTARRLRALLGARRSRAPARPVAAHRAGRIAGAELLPPLRTRHAGGARSTRRAGASGRASGCSPAASPASCSPTSTPPRCAC